MSPLRRHVLTVVVLLVAALGVSVFYLSGPVAVDDAFILRGTGAGTGEGRYEGTLGVLFNDVRLPYGTTAILASDAEHGSVTLSPDGGWTYDPDEEGFKGDDQFRYTLSVPLRNTATVLIVVTNPITKMP